MAEYSYEVSETLELDPEGGVCGTRYLTLRNEAASPVQVLLNNLEEVFPDSAIAFEVHDVTEGRDVADVAIEDHHYSRKLRWSVAGLVLPPQGHHQYRVQYRRSAIAHLARGYVHVTVGYASESRCAYGLTVVAPTPIEKVEVRTLSPAIAGGGEEHTLKGDRSVVFGIRQVSMNRPFRLELALRVVGLVDVPNLPVVSFVVHQLRRGEWFGEGARSMNQYVFLVIQHLLTDFLAFAQALKDLGVHLENVHIVGIPYSSKPQTVLGLKGLGFTNVWAPRDYPFEEEVTAALQASVDRARALGSSLVVIEDGGYAIPRLHSPEFVDSLPLVLGGVEQTANGIWADDMLAANGMLRLPVIDVARCDLKTRLEAPLIGQAVVDNIRRLLQSRGRDVMNKNVLVLGYGSIGKRVVASLKGNNVNRVAVFDTNEERRKEAVADGLTVIETFTSATVGDYSIVIGCTGKQKHQAPLDAAALLSLPHHCIIVNATSKKGEVNYSDLEGITADQRVHAEYGTDYTLSNDLTITILANGFPVNFFGEAQSVTDSAIQFIPALLLACAGYLASRTLDAGIHEVPDWLQCKIESVHNAQTRR